MRSTASWMLALGLASAIGLDHAKAEPDREPDGSFAAADSNSDGRVDDREFSDLRLQPQMYDRWFQEADTDHDGVLNPDEYEHARTLAIASIGLGA